MWQLELIKFSFKKREKLEILQNWVGNLDNKICLDLGTAKGTLSYYLKLKGGKWIHVDLDFENLASAKELLLENLALISSSVLPFKNNSFDFILSLDYLEHLEDDNFCLKEINRIAKLNSTIMISTPTSGKHLFLNKIKPLLGLTLDKYGHKRIGYSFEQLKKLLENSGFSIVKSKTYSFFLTESIEMFLNFLFIHLEKNKSLKRDGLISPSSKEQFFTHRFAFNLYKFFYPIIWFISRLDYFFKILGAYAIIIEAKKIKSIV